MLLLKLWALSGSVAARVFHTTAGALTEDEVGYILAHQHLFVEFGVKDPVAYLTSTREEVFRVIGPLVQEAKLLGYSVFIDPTMEGVGRRPDIVAYIANRVGLPTMMATGFYWDFYLPDWVRTATVRQIKHWLVEELTIGVGDTHVRAGFIKLAQSADGITPAEMKVLQAACEAAKLTGASIASHILSSGTALAVINALERFGCDPHRFIWVHAPYTAFTEGAAGLEALLAAAEAGVFISDDFIGSKFWSSWLDGNNPHTRHMGVIQALVSAGYEDQILIGSDTGWFDPGDRTRPIEPYSQIVNLFLPEARAAGFSEELIYKLMHTNPWQAYSR
jgi:phosphotriesterase-related protein